MSKGRRTPPLFDVLSGVEGRARPGQGGSGGGSGGANGAGVVGNGARVGSGLPIQVQIPATAPRSSAGVDVGEMRPLSGERSGGAGRMGAPWIWIGVACVLALLAAAWFFAFQMGKQNAEKELIGRIDPGAAAPGAGGMASPTPALPQPTPNQPTPTQPGQAPVNKPLLPVENTPTVADQGVNGIFSTENDPRQLGVNYLHIVSLAPADAADAVGFLTKNGVRAGAVPDRKVDGRGGTANNPALLLVFVLEGVPSDRYKATAKERADLEQRVRTLGKQFQRDQRGASDFASPQWTKFESR